METSLVSTTGEDRDDERLPLVSSSPLRPSSPSTTDDEIHLWQPPEPQPATASIASPPPDTRPAKSPRLVSLDVFRGLTVAIMILVDDAGGAFPSINHAPWFGVTLADYVMPSFLFIIGVSIALVFKKISSKSSATKKVIIRTIKLFVLGLIIQGGFFHGHNNLTYGVDIDRIRLFGVLQRIAIGYFLAAISEIWLIRNVSVDSAISFVRKYYLQWAVAAIVSMLYIGLLLGLYVPDWEFQVQSKNFTNVRTNGTLLVQCGVRGSLDPPCNAVGLVDRFVLGQNHLYMHPVYKRTKECSVNSPDYGPLPSGAPVWCSAPFDPEGLLSTMMAAVTCFVGLFFGHIIIHYKVSGQYLLQQFNLFLACKLLMYQTLIVILLLGMPFSKPLYSVSYMFLTAGVSGFALIFIYFMVDIIKFTAPLVIFQWMGMNALIVFILAASEIFPIFLQGFYWHSPSNNLVSLTEAALQKICNSKRWGTLAFVLLEVLFWGLVAGVLHIKGIYYKL
ncbi:heparan-alpha-glucosaminide N-acetyltransferase-like isoform X1 [Carex littledalei]|uniref:Heparan-alpha-glucosaminide N-acetyltransferase-like isoform X1 n=1 Tax=Carex littledalei TaxID=544730 RepID=A0A833RAR5_9POAL|nr:heparan-alpha-glucosaminide N-acetyltransferase-like isoform X1 [Carex littledalei]